MKLPGKKDPTTAPNDKPKQGRNEAITGEDVKPTDNVLRRQSQVVGGN